MGKEQCSEIEKDSEEVRIPGDEKSPVIKVESLNKENDSVNEKESVNKSEKNRKHEVNEKFNVQSEELNISENEVNIAEKEVNISQKEVNVSEHEVSTPLNIDLSAFDNDQAFTVNDDNNDLIEAQEKDAGMVQKVTAFESDTSDVIIYSTEK